MQMKLESVESRQKISENIKKKFVKQFFLYDGGKTRPPAQPRFLKTCFNLLSNYTCDFSKNQLVADKTGKC